MSRALPGGPRNLPRLTSLRFHGALVVFLFHVGRLNIHWAPASLFRWGYTGVTFFFVLSGFVLTWSFGPHARAWTFWRRRIARILPVYLLVTLATIPLLSAFGETFHPRVLIAHLTLLQAWSADGTVSLGLNRASWSLSNEAFFYATFPIVVLVLWRASARRRWSIAVGWLLVTGLAWLTLAAFGLDDPAYTNPVLHSSEFVLGIVLALALRDGWSPQIRLASVLVAMALAATAYTLAPGKIGGFIMVLPFAALILGAAVADTEQRHSWLTARPCTWLGEVSYAFYLVHSLVIRFAARQFDWSRHWSIPAGLGIVLLLFGVSLAISAVLHHTVELPLQRLIAGQRGGPARAAAEPFSGRLIRHTNAGLGRRTRASSSP